MVLLGASTASAEAVARLEASVAQPLTAPARDWFGTGFAVAVSAGYDVLTFLELSGRVQYVFVSGRSSAELGPASVLAVGPAVRVHRPRDAAWQPFGEVSLQYVRTGPLDRLGLHLEMGALFKLGPVALGPWVGIQQVFRLADAETYPTRDATVFLAGASVELSFFGPQGSVSPTSPPIEPLLPNATAASADVDADGIAAPADRCPNLPEDRDRWEDDDGCPDPDDDGDGVLDAEDLCKRLRGPALTFGCPDRDGDAVSDADDRCPATAGEAAESGCPAYRDVKVRGTRLELSRSLGFDRKSAAIPPAAGAMLFEATRAVLDRGSVCVHVIGHGDATGKAAASSALASARAQSVRMFLMSKGIAPAQVTASGAVGPPFGDVELQLAPCEVNAP